LPPKGDYATNYKEFRTEGRCWTAINVMPDLPSVAGVILDAYEASIGESLDGVILADPFALASIPRSSGPVELPRYGVEVVEANVVRFHDKTRPMVSSTIRRPESGSSATWHERRSSDSSPSHRQTLRP
jgi:Protein of unknown function (DUF4012)